MSQHTKRTGRMPCGAFRSSARRQAKEWREANLEKRKEQERAAWHRRKAKVKAQKMARLEQAVINTVNAIS